MKQMLKEQINQAEKILMRSCPKLGIRLRYYRMFGKWLHLKNPKTFAEKIQWLKLHYQQPQIIKLADKYEVREYITKAVGSEYLIPLLGVWNHPEQVDFSQLPEQFVLKPNNSSGRVFICRDKSALDENNIREQMKRWEEENLTKITGEWVYEKIPFKIICEEFLEDKIVDYKIYFGNGRFICTQVIGGRSEGNKTFGYMDEKWQLLPIRRKGVLPMTEPPAKPKDYEQMLEIAGKLAQGFPFIRVDLYYVAGRIYFGELSFYPNNGFVAYETKQMDDCFSCAITLPEQEDR